MVKSHFIQSVRDNVAELYYRHRIDSAAERLEFIDSLLADNKDLVPVAEYVEGGVCGPNATHRELKADNVLLASTLLAGGSHPVVNLHQTISSGE